MKLCRKDDVEKIGFEKKREVMKRWREQSREGKWKLGVSIEGRGQ